MNRQYIIVIKDSAINLIAEVNKSLVEGWVPLGGVVVLKESGGTKWIQSLVREVIQEA